MAVFLAVVVISCNQKLPGSEPLQDIAAQESTLAAQNEEPDSDAVDLSRVIPIDPATACTLPPGAAQKQAYLVVFQVSGSAKQAMSAYALPGKPMSRTVAVGLPWTAAAVGLAGDSVTLSARSAPGIGAGNVLVTILSAPMSAQKSGLFEIARKKYIASRDSLTLAGPSGNAEARRGEIEHAYKLAEYKLEQDLQPLGSSTGYGNQLALLIEVLK